MNALRLCPNMAAAWAPKPSLNSFTCVCLTHHCNKKKNVSTANLSWKCCQAFILCFLLHDSDLLIFAFFYLFIYFKKEWGLLSLFVSLRSNCAENIRKHILHTGKHEGVKMYNCPKCNYATNSPMEFRNHLKENHPDIENPDLAYLHAGKTFFNLLVEGRVSVQEWTLAAGWHYLCSWPTVPLFLLSTFLKFIFWMTKCLSGLRFENTCLHLETTVPWGKPRNTVWRSLELQACLQQCPFTVTHLGNAHYYHGFILLTAEQLCSSCRTSSVSLKEAF